MLAGLLFLGVIAASAMPDIMSSLRGSADDDVDQSGDDAPEDEVVATGEGSLLDDTDVPEDDDHGEGVDLFTDPAVGLTEVDAFKPGADSLTIEIPDEAGNFALGSDPETGTASLTYDIEAGEVEIRFTEMDEVPMDDVYLRVSDASSPTQYSDISLNAVLEPIVGEDEDNSDILPPEDPDLPDIGDDDGTDDEDQVLYPVDPTEPDDPIPPLPDEEQVLYPVMDDIAPVPDFEVYPEVEETVLAPDTAPDDATYADRAFEPLSNSPVLEAETSETATPLTGTPGVSDTFWLYPPVGAASPEIAEVSDFTPGEDLLRISLDTTTGDGPGVVSVTGSDDGLDGWVQIDGVTVAVLKGAPGASVSDVFVESRPNSLPDRA